MSELGNKDRDMRPAIIVVLLDSIEGLSKLIISKRGTFLDLD